MINEKNIPVLDILREIIEEAKKHEGWGDENDIFDMGGCVKKSL